MECVIRGELFRAGRDDSKYRVRWFELTKKGDLTWGEGEVAALKASMPMLGCQIVLSKELDGLEVKLPEHTRNFYVDGHVPEPH